MMINEQKARRYCKDDLSLIENYEQAAADQTHTWDIHHRRETIYSRNDLIEIGEYFHRPAAELIFLTRGEHRRLHMSGTYLSSETRAKMSASLSGENHPMFGKHHSAETRTKLSASLSGENGPNFGKHFSAETRAKMSAARAGKRLSEETRAKMRAARKAYLARRRLV